MAISNELYNKSDKLVQQLAGLQYIVDTNPDVINKDPVTREFLAFKVEIALSFVEELQVWKTLGNQAKCNSAIANAQFFMEQAQVLLDRMLDEYCEEAWSDFQKELAFTPYVPTDYNHILNNDITVPPGNIAW